MPRIGSLRLSGLADRVRAGLGRLEVLALFPILALFSVWFGNQNLLIVSAFLLPALLAVQAIGRGAPKSPEKSAPSAVDGVTGLPGRPALQALLTRIIQEKSPRKSVAIFLQIDDFEGVLDRWGRDTVDEILHRVAERLQAAVRDGDLVARTGDAAFGLVLTPIRGTKLDLMMDVIARLQSAVSEPIAIGGSTANVTCSVGYCGLDQAPKQNAKSVIEATEAALAEARHNAPVAIRAFSAEVRAKRRRRADRADAVEAAFAAGEFKAWYQPQISTDTGAITGFEALARWRHPDEGVLPPAEFLDAIADAGHMARLGETMLYHALSALRSWDRAGLAIPSVAVNFSAEELRDPQLADRIKWEVDRFDLRPARLTIEILETVAAQSEDDVIIRNIQMLGSHGFNLDLDDFGTGQASIGNIRRFHVNRIKIDRSFVTNLDKDPSQQAMVAAILSLAEHLGVDTLAEGVESIGEHSMLAQLGCGHVQGFGLARPMPFDDTIAWARAHNDKLGPPPNAIGWQAG